MPGREPERGKEVKQGQRLLGVDPSCVGAQRRDAPAAAPQGSPAWAAASRRRRPSSRVKLVLDVPDVRAAAVAQEVQREVLAIEKQMLGPEHPNTLTTAGNLVSSL